MTRSWPERLAKRIGRLSENLDQIEAKGRTSDKAYSRMLEELGDLCRQILDARDEAQAELNQTKTDALFIRRKLADEKNWLKAERESFEKERVEFRACRKASEAETVRVQGELAKERAELQAATDRAKEAERKFRKFIETIDNARSQI